MGSGLSASARLKVDRFVPEFGHCASVNNLDLVQRWRELLLNFGDSKFGSCPSYRRAS